MKRVKVSESFLDDPIIKEIFQTPSGVQIYLAVGSSHIRSQFFNDDILKVVKQVNTEKPKTAEELRRIFSGVALNDSAARSPWDYPTTYVRQEHPDSTPLEKQEIKLANEQNAKRANERMAKFQELLNAINGIEPWTFVII